MRVKRVLLALAVALLAIGAVGAVSQIAEADASPGVAASGQWETCQETSPANAGSDLGSACVDYLYQVQCQFEPMDIHEAQEWYGWCDQHANLQTGSNPEVPMCNAPLAERATAVGSRCLDYLANTTCKYSPNDATLHDFCAQHGDEAGGDPRPQRCDTEVAQQRSDVGNRCFTRLKKNWCGDYERWGNAGAQDRNDFCEAAKNGAKAPPASCTVALAKKKTPAGIDCAKDLAANECKQPANQLPKDIATYCTSVASKSDQDVAREEREAKQKGTGAGSGPSDAKPVPNPPPATPPEQEQAPPPNNGSPDVLLQLGHEPACGESEQLSDELKRACAVTGSAMHNYPFADYGIDNNVRVDFLSSDFWDGEAPIMSVFQWLLVGVWQILIWLIKISLLVVQWAFAIDPLSRAGGRVSDTVGAVFDMIGVEWRLTAVAILGVWCFWSGLVKRRFMQTLSGALLSLVLMLSAMVIAYDPQGTVGWISKLANESSVTVLSATSTGELNKPEQGLADGQHRLFDQLVVGPWCALEFGGQGACYKKTNDEKITRADLWLSLPANSSAREVLYLATKEGPEAAEAKSQTGVWDNFTDALGDGLCMFSVGLSGTCPDNEDDLHENQSQEDKRNDPEATKQFEDAKAKAIALIKEESSAVELQGSSGTLSRAGLLVLVAVGVLGAVAFFFALGVRLLVAAVILLLLILLAPLMMIVAAFGEEGRSRVGTYWRMLLGAAVAKLVYSLLLGLVLAVVFILIDIAGKEENDWLGCWLLVSAFFWIAVAQMNRVLSLFSPDPAADNGRGMGAGGLGAMYMGQRMVSGVMRRATRAATFLPRQAAPRAARAIRREHQVQSEGMDNAIRGRADTELERRGQGVRDLEHADADRAAEVMTKTGTARRNLQGIEARLKRPGLSVEGREQLEGHKRQVEGTLQRLSGEEQWARSYQPKGNRRPGQEPTSGEIREQRQQRERDVAHWREHADSWSSESNRRWAGISESEWAHAQQQAKRGHDEPMEGLRARSERALQRDQTLFERTDRDAPLARGTRNEANREWGGDQGMVHRQRGASPGRPPDREFAERQRDERRAARRRGREHLNRRRGYR